MHRFYRGTLRSNLISFVCLPVTLACAITPSAWACDAHSKSAHSSQSVYFDASNLPIEAKKSANVLAHAVTLSAEASREVLQDRVQITLFYEQQADNASKLTTLLKEKTEQALQIAKNASGISIQTRKFTLHPTINQKGRISGWQGRTELLLESTHAEDLAPIGRLAGRLAPIMSISSIRFSLSPQAEQAISAQLTQEAIAAFRKEAQQTAQAFGYQHYALADIGIHRNNFQIQGNMMMASARADFSTPSADIPIAQGKTSRSVTVSGVVHLLN